jgi:hypothetical protein
MILLGGLVCLKEKSATDGPDRASSERVDTSAFDIWARDFIDLARKLGAKSGRA